MRHYISCRAWTQFSRQMSPPLYGRLIARWRHGRWCHRCGKGPCFYSTRGPTGSLLVVAMFSLPAVSDESVLLDLKHLLMEAKQNVPSFLAELEADSEKYLDIGGESLIYHILRLFLRFVPSSGVFTVIFCHLSFQSHHFHVCVHSIHPPCPRILSKCQNIANFATFFCTKFKPLRICAVLFLLFPSAFLLLSSFFNI